MSAFPAMNIHCQKGVTLVSLLVGLFLSMLCILATLTVYKNMISVSVEAKSDTVHDGQLAAAFLTTQLEIQSAGFQISEPDDTDVVTRVNSGKLELLWRFNDGSYRCRGLVEELDPGSDINYRVLKLVEATTGCNADDALTGLTWNEVATLGRWAIRGRLADFMTGRDAMLDVNIATTSCSPYGAVATSEHMVVTISAPSSAAIHGASAGATTSFKYCLLNT